jgi:hypothetical protein
MKEIMYKSGTEGRFGYLGPAEGQMILSQFDINKLKNYLLKKFNGKSISYENLRRQTIMETEAVKANYRSVLQYLDREGKIEIDGKGPRGGVNNESIIKFL